MGTYSIFGKKAALLISEECPGGKDVNLSVSELTVIHVWNA